jgi:hypothetical protein
MMSKQVKFEQIALDRIITNARTNFRRTIQSTKAKILLIGSFDGKSDIVNEYIKLKRPGIDLRKKLAEDDERLRAFLTVLLPDAKTYVRWIRSSTFNPIWEESLVSYCGAFEMCLKAIAMAFYVGEKQSDGLAYQVFMPGDELTKARRFITKEWSKEIDELPRCQWFYERFIRDHRFAHNFRELVSIPADSWDVCSTAFQIRNAIVHNLSVLPVTVELHGTAFHAGDRVEISFGDIRRIEGAFERVLSPFSDALDDFFLDD